MLNWFRKFKVLTAFSQPISWALLASIGLYSIVEIEEKNNTIAENWTRQLSVQMAEFDRVALSKVMAIETDPLIQATIAKIYQTPEALLINLSHNFSLKKIPSFPNINRPVANQQNQKLGRRQRHQKINSIPRPKPRKSQLDMTLPIANEIRITSEFGWRTHPVFGNRGNFHSGIDFGASTGTPVLAVYDGKVKKAGWQGGYGLTVVLEHDLPLPPDRQGEPDRRGRSKTLYAHLSKVLVKPGEMVQAGDAIGHVGSTGYSTGPHLHLELHELTDEGWQKIDPTPRLAAAIAHRQQQQQRAWLEATILAHETEFYAWVKEFSRGLTNLIDRL